MRRPLVVSIGLALAASLVPLTPRLAAADPCTPSRAMIVLDKSSSMVTGTIGSETKWAVATSALDAVAAAYENTIELGLMTFPNPDECSPGSVNLDVALGNRAAIAAELDTPPPSAGNWTPMSQTLDAAAGVPSLLDPARQRFVVLITDGWQWCSPYDPATRFDPVDSVAALRMLGVTTYVVGFGGGVDALALNQMAVEAGTALPGCDPTGDTPTAANPCYYRADAPSDLVLALDDIALHISAESCDAQDNDCDGLVDEELTQACATSCGAGVETCSAGSWTGCDAPPATAEICDGLDNDCDGTADPGCACIAGETRPCGESDEGACAIGTQRCGADGSWGDCEGAVSPVAEMCNGEDDDCDGLSDEIDDGDDLCAGSLVCVNGGCAEPDNPSLPPAEGDAAGCACEVGRRDGDVAAAAPILLIGLIFVISSRRRRI